MIRKCLAALLLLSLLIPAAACAEGELRGYSAEEGYVYVTFGRYPQHVDGGAFGDVNLSWEWYESRNEAVSGPFDPEPVIWRVLSADEEKVYLLSEYVLFAHPLHSVQKEYTKFKGNFAKTELCALLNGTFAEEAFTEAELVALKEFEGIGKVFLPSGDETKDTALGFSPDKRERVKWVATDQKKHDEVVNTNEPRKAWATEYAIRVTGACVYPMQRGCHTPYWMRDPSKNTKGHGRQVKNFGQLGTINCITEDIGVRPGVYLDPDGYEITGGSGTLEDPYAVVPKGQEGNQQ